VADESMARLLQLSTILLVVLPCSLFVALTPESVAEEYGTIFIREDGSVDPGTSPLQREGDFYTMTDNMTTNSVRGIVILRSNITLDGAGFTLNGTALGYSTLGINLDYGNNVTIRNFHVTTFGTAILLDSSDTFNNNVNGNRITDCLDGIRIVGTDNTIAYNNMTNCSGAAILGGDANGNRLFGNIIEACNKGIWIEESIDLEIYENNIAGNQETGIDLRYCSAINTFDNYMFNNYQGFDISFSQNVTISTNIVSANERYAILLGSNVSDTNVFGNTIGFSDTGIGGLCSNSLIRDNVVTENRGYGIDLRDSFNNTIEENLITQGNYSGISLTYSYNNLVRANNISEFQDVGIYLDSSHANTVCENTINENAKGAVVYGENNTFYRNYFLNNTKQVVVSSGAHANSWDSGYPPEGYGGNYWSDFQKRYPNATDIYGGPNQDQPGSDTFWDNPYIIDSVNQDNYAIVPELSIAVLPLVMAALTAIIIYRKRQSVVRATESASSTA